MLIQRLFINTTLNKILFYKNINEYIQYKDKILNVITIKLNTLKYR